MGRLLRKSWVVLITGMLAMLIAGCGGGGSNNAGNVITPPPDTPTGSATFTITWPARTRVIPEAADSITILIKQSGILYGRINATRPALADTQAVVVSEVASKLPFGFLSFEATAYSGEHTGKIILGTANGAFALTASSRNYTIDMSLSMTSQVKTIKIASANGKSLVAVGNTLSLLASACNAGDAIIPLGEHALTWTSSDPTLATVDPYSGVVTGVHGGTVTIYATDRESHMRGEFTVTVDDLVPRITVTDLNNTPITSGTTTTLFRFKVNATNGTEQVGNIRAHWDFDGYDGEPTDDQYLPFSQIDHLFTVAGDYTVRVQIIDAQGKIGSDTVTIHIDDDTETILVAPMVYAEQEGFDVQVPGGPSSTLFKVKVPSILTSNGAVIEEGYVRFDWNGDGIYDTAFTKYRYNVYDPMKFPMDEYPMATHQYTNDGLYTVYVQVKDMIGRVGINSVTIDVRPKTWP